jgi:hypothetical protein
MTASSRPRLAALLIALLIGATALPPALHADMDDLAWVRSMRAFEVAHVGTPTSIASVEALVFGPAEVATSSPAAPGTSRAPPLS